MTTSKRKLEWGEELQVGDTVIAKHPLVTHTYVISRVTNKFAFVKINSSYEGKLPRIYEMGFQFLPRQKWNTTYYTVLREINETTNEEHDAEGEV